MIRVYNRLQKADVYTICFLFCIALFFLPADYVIGNTLSNFFRIMREFMIIPVLLIAIQYVRVKKYKPTKTLLGILLLFFWVHIGATFFSSRTGTQVSWIGAIRIYLEVFLFSVICDMGLCIKPKKFLFSFVCVGSIMCILNAISFFIYGYNGGMNRRIEWAGRQLSQNYFLLAEDNATYFWTYPSLAVVWLYYYRYKRTLLFGFYSWIFTIITSVAYVYMESVMASLACLSLPVILFLLNRRINKSMDKPGKNQRKRMKRGYGKHFVILSVIGIGFQILLSLQYLIPHVAFLATNYFGKTATLSNRVFIWTRSLYYISRSIIFGYGYEKAEATTNKILINHTHNMYLETLYRGGTIGIVLFVFLLFCIFLYTRKVNQNALYYFMVLVVFVFFIVSSVEFAYYRYHYLVIYLLISNPKIYDGTLKMGEKNYKKTKIPKVSSTVEKGGDLVQEMTWK